MSKTQQSHQSTSPREAANYGTALSRPDDSGIDLTSFDISGRDTSLNLGSDTAINPAGTSRKRAPSPQSTEIPNSPKSDILTQQNAHTIDLRDKNGADLRKVQKIAPSAESEKFRELQKLCIRAEKELTAKEAYVSEPDSTGWWGKAKRAFRAAVTFVQRSNLENQIKTARTEQDWIVRQVQKRASQMQCNAFINSKKIPPLLRWASVPESKQSKLPSFEKVEKALMQYEKNENVKMKELDGGLALQRTLPSGGVQSLVLRHHSDGRVSLLCKSGENEWRRLGTVWSDVAQKIGVRFMEMKEIKLKPPAEGKKYLIQSVQLQDF